MDQRELQHDAQPVSLGLVNKVVRRLGDAAFVENCSEDAGIRLRDPRWFAVGLESSLPV